jgi:hypothetical protein
MGQTASDHCINIQRSKHQQKWRRQVAKEAYIHLTARVRMHVQIRAPEVTILPTQKRGQGVHCKRGALWSACIWSARISIVFHLAWSIQGKVAPPKC